MKPIPTLQHPSLMCGTAGCAYDARVRVRRNKAQWAIGKPNPVHVPYGPWLNLCHSCDDRRHHQESIEYCELMGLDTPAKQRTWCLDQIKRGKDMLNSQPKALEFLPPMREPGED